MKNFFLSLFGLLITVTSFAQYGTYTTPVTVPSNSTYSTNTYSTNTYDTSPNSQYNSGYTKQNGTVVQPYYSTQKDNTNLNNYSTQGNVNPYTGREGTRARDYSSEALNYGQGKTIQQGPRGGQYYINDNGNKVYVPKRSNPY